MYSTPSFPSPAATRSHSSSGRRTPQDFLSIPNLETIEERSSRHSSQPDRTTTTASDISGSVNAEGITALPEWSGYPIPEEPRPALTRHGSRDRILEKGCWYAEDSDQSGNHAADESEGDYIAAHGRDGHRRPSRTIIWLLLCVAILFALAIVLGAVLGTFVGGKSSSSPSPSVTEVPAGTTPTPTQTDGPDPTSSPTAPASTHIHAFAGAGFGASSPDGHFSSWLFSQDAEGYLSRHTFDSRTGNWTRVSNFAEARLKTPLAATAFQNPQSGSGGYHVSLIYLDNKAYLSEWTFSETGSELGHAGHLTPQKYIAHENTSLAFSYPSLMYQGLAGEIRKAYFSCHPGEHDDCQASDDGEWDPECRECWHSTPLSTTTDAANGTRLVLASSFWGDGGATVNLFYREKSGRVVNYTEDDEGNETAPKIWENSAFSRHIPVSATIAGFTVPSPRPQTYLLWQDERGTMQMSYSAPSDGEWRGPVALANSAFAGADKDTALACAAIPGGQDWGFARCFFQAGKAVREVRLVSAGGSEGRAEGEWEVVGNVPTFGF